MFHVEFFLFSSTQTHSDTNCEWLEGTYALTLFLTTWCHLNWQMTLCLSLSGSRDEGDSQQQWDTIIVVYWVQFHIIPETLPMKCWPNCKDTKRIKSYFKGQEHAHLTEKCSHTLGMGVFQMMDQIVKAIEKCMWLCVA